MKTWRGNDDLPSTVSDDTMAWMTEAAATGKMNPARPVKTRQYGDPNVFEPDDDGTGEEDE